MAQKRLNAFSYLGTSKRLTMVLLGSSLIPSESVPSTSETRLKALSASKPPVAVDSPPPSLVVTRKPAP